MNDSVGEQIGHFPDFRSYLPSDEFPSTMMVGIEVEMEDWKSGTKYLQDSMLWKSVGDGSLRGNYRTELVTTAPLSGHDLDVCLKELEYAIKKNVETYGHPYLSDRTSIHIHLDMRNVTLDELRSIINTYATVERVLFRYADTTNREHGNFCVPLYKNSGWLSTISKKIISGINPRGVNAEQRYSAMNVASLWKHGTLEFRHMSGTTDVNRIREWICILMTMVEYAKSTHAVWADTPTIVSMDGPDVYLTNVFGKYKDAVVSYLTDDFDLQHELIAGARVAQDIIYGKQFEDIAGTYEELFLPNGGSLVERFIEKHDLVSYSDLDESEDFYEDDFIEDEGGF